MNDKEFKENLARIIAKKLCPNRYTHFMLYKDEITCYSKNNFAECRGISELVDEIVEFLKQEKENENRL